MPASYEAIHPTTNFRLPFFSAGFRRTPLYLVCVVVAFVILYASLRPSFPSTLLDPPEHGAGNLSSQSRPVKQATARLDDKLFPVYEPHRTDSWIDANHKMIRDLLLCMQLSNCKPKQDKIVILASHHFLGAIWGWTGGEDIWARSTITALRNTGYTFLYAESNQHVKYIHQMFPEMVRVILVEDLAAVECFKDNDCVLSDSNPNGVPAWKFLSFDFWADTYNPLGSEWTLNPEKWDSWDEPNVYLGYSVEPSCKTQPFIPHSERPHQGYIMTKRLSYFAEGPLRAWGPEFYEAAAGSTGINFIVGAQNDTEESGLAADLPPSLRNIGETNQKDFLAAVSRSRVLIGVGRPYSSPTPYEALCLGVPFINPVVDWDKNHPSDRKQWNAQHGILKYSDPPFVYNVFKGDSEGFVAAIQNALAHPIESHIPDRMLLTSIESRLTEIIEKDWKGKAIELLALRKAGNITGLLFTI